MAYIVQPIDADIGRSLQIASGNGLDRWLMYGENLVKWEGKMTAKERRILITKLVVESIQFIMASEQEIYYGLEHLKDLGVWSH